MTSTAPTGTDRPRGSARREALLAATLALVGELGVDAVTHRAVARRADLPLASTTYWFESKEQLLTEALRHAAQQDTARLHAEAEALTAAGRAPVSPGAIVGLVLADDADGGGDRGTLLAAYTLMLEAARRPGLQAIAEAWNDTYRSVLADMLARAGSRRPADDARLVLAATDGLVVDRLAAGRDHDDAALDLQRLIGALLGDGR